MELDFKCPKRNRLRTVICISEKSDTGGLMALAHYLLTPKYEVEGIIITGGNGKKENSKIVRLLEILKIHGEYPVVGGAERKIDEHERFVESEGADFICEQLKKEDERPLYVSVLGELTDAASAYSLLPEKCNKMHIIWAGGAPWPGGGREEFLERDINAANILLGSDVPFWQIPRDTYQRLCISSAELQARILPFGKLGKYLAVNAMEEIRNRKDYSDALILPGEAVFGALFNPFDHSYECCPAPRVNHQMYYIHNQYRRPVRVYYFLDSRMILEDFYSKLAVLYGKEERYGEPL